MYKLGAVERSILSEAPVLVRHAALQRPRTTMEPLPEAHIDDEGKRKNWAVALITNYIIDLLVQLPLQVKEHICNQLMETHDEIVTALMRLNNPDDTGVPALENPMDMDFTNVHILNLPQYSITAELNTFVKEFAVMLNHLTDLAVCFSENEPFKAVPQTFTLKTAFELIPDDRDTLFREAHFQVLIAMMRPNKTVSIEYKVKKRRQEATDQELNDKNTTPDPLTDLLAKQVGTEDDAKENPLNQFLNESRINKLRRATDDMASVPRRLRWLLDPEPHQRKP